MKHRQGDRKMSKRLKRCLAILLCTMLTCSLVTFPAHAADHVHQWVDGKWDEEGYDCLMGHCKSYYKECSICHAKQYTAYRSWTGEGKRTSHTWGPETIIQGTCPKDPVKQRTCSVCGHTEQTGGGDHKWTAWSGSTERTSCDQVITLTRKCTACGATDTKTEGPYNHHWIENSRKNPTCTTPGESYESCSGCHATRTVEIPAKGHSFTNDLVCQDRVCTTCGQTVRGTSHQYGLQYQKSAQGHWQICLYCKEGSAISPHSDQGDGTCVCGWQVKANASTCSHEWKISRQTSTFTHEEKCTKCGATKSVNCSTTPNYDARKYCTDPLYCVCGHKISDGQKNHNFGTWICHDSTHAHKCLNINCEYGTEEPHSFAIKNGINKCVVCNFSAGAVAHTHTGGTPNCLGVATCSVCGEVYQAGTKGSHTGGTPDCKGNAVCSVCHSSYQTGKTGSHTGGTEIRGSKAAGTGVAGYTGDTYCLTCGEKIKSGSAIPALAANHTHSYADTWSKDSVHHWHACQCGDKKDEALHSYKDGKCTVCGEADPAYKTEEDHTHSYAEGWAADQQNHWRVCSICGEKAEIAAHTEQDGKCSVCGMATGTAAAAGKFTDIASKDWYYSAVERVVEAGLMKGVSNTSFAPGSTLDRAMLATMLYRLAGTPAVDHGSGFGDVKASDYYADAVAWASENKIVEGKGGNSFAPDSDITRQEIATILYRYAVKSGYVTGSVGTLPDTYTDKGKVASWAQEAMAWAFQTKIITGRGAGQLAPAATASRAEAATMLVRFMDLIEASAA